MEARFWLSLQAACDLSRARSEGDYEAVLPRDAAWRRDQPTVHRTRSGRPACGRAWRWGCTPR